MAVNRYARAGGALGHLLLVVVLALGVFVMHTVGHPSEAHGSGTGQASHGPAAAMPLPGSAHGKPVAHRQPDAREKPAAQEKPTAHGKPVALGFGEAPHAAPAGHAASTDAPVGAGDMASLCVAVLLAAWALAALVRWALARRPGRPAASRARAGALPRPDPPPRGTDLTRLSVLRL
ncbi:hypothetical protein SUDANB108_03752 [Streptomyces sp. enrichment culture]|uniref:DUF6153 family protein n=1 Tax=Streptomyces sp. enrichment culture TaxID=1795815 RepID=UPI003F54FA6B